MLLTARQGRAYTSASLGEESCSAYFYRNVYTRPCLYRYPKIIRDCIEDIPEWVNGTEVPVDTSAANPNGLEYDNLYLVCLHTAFMPELRSVLAPGTLILATQDMNGIVHPCFHPEDKVSPCSLHVVRVP